MIIKMHTLDVNTSNVPAFLIKLWKLVEDPSCDDLIAWSDRGISFIIRDQARFASELLPQYFKHNNMASFVRQLNMYGFRKVMNYGLKTDNNEMEFQHSFFVKDQSELLELIKRKIPNTRLVSEPVMKSNAKDILSDLTSIRDKQENMDNMLVKMKQENELLWKELTNMRQKHKQQEQVIEKVIHFLLQVIRNPSVGIQRSVPRMLHDSPNSKGNASQITALELLRKNPDLIMKNKNASRPVIHEVIDVDPEKDSQDKTNKLFLTIKNSPKNASAKSPLQSVSPLSIVLSPASQSNEYGPINSPSLSSPGGSLDSLNMLEPLQARISTINEEDLEDESVLGIPLEYITAKDVEYSLNSDQNNHVISLPKKSTVRNVISIPKNGNVSNVVSIPECSQIGSVLSIPEGSDIGNIITISEGSNSGNVISIPEGSKISNIISIPVDGNIGSVLSIPEPTKIENVISIPEENDNSSTNTKSTNQNVKACNASSIFNETVTSEGVDAKASNALTLMKVDDLVIPDLYDTTVCEDDLDSEKNSLHSNLSKPGYVDPIMADSLNTPQIHLGDDIDLSDLTVRGCKDKDKKDFPSKYSSDVNITEQEHDYLPSTSTASSSNISSSTTANIQNLMNALCRREKRNENTLSNHLLIVEEELNRLQDNITSTDSWNVDADKLLGVCLERSLHYPQLFSSDGMVSNEDFVDQLRDDITIKKEPEDLENELGLLSPPMLGVELDDLRSPFLEQLDPVIVNSNDLDDELPDTKDVLLVGGSYDQEDSSTVKYSDLSSTNAKRRKSSNSKITKVKRRRVK